MPLKERAQRGKLALPFFVKQRVPICVYGAILQLLKPGGRIFYFLSCTAYTCYIFMYRALAVLVISCFSGRGGGMIPPLDFSMSV